MANPIKKAVKKTKKAVKKAKKKTAKKVAKKSLKKTRKAVKKAVKKTAKRVAKKIADVVMIPKRKGPKPIEGPKLKKGQVWEDVPAGSESAMIRKPRQILVDRISRTKGIAFCTVTSPAKHRQHGTGKLKKVGKIGRKLEIRIDRFRPVRGGYNLLA